ncbi:MAG: hypothetical protein RL071_1445 [Pseudomonadota bacterium]
MSRPLLHPDLLRALREGAPPRAQKRVDLEPALAEAWTWRPGPPLTVETDGGETVTLDAVDGALSAPGQLRCTCPIGPRCLHVLAVACALPVRDAQQPAAAEAPPARPPVVGAAPEPPPVAVAPPPPAAGAGRPAARPGLRDELTALVPSRAARRLDAEPTLAESWAWTGDLAGARVTTDGGEVVELAAEGGVVRRLDQLRCSCALGPRCLHALAAVRALPVEGAPAAAPSAAAPSAPADLAPAPAGAPSAPPAGTGAPVASTSGAAPASSAPVPVAVDPPLAPSAARTVARLQAAVEPLLAEGLLGASDGTVAALRRAIYAARVEGLYRLARAGAAVLRAGGALRKGRQPGASVIELMLELLLTAHELDRRGAAPAWVGEGRRAYRPAGQLRLTGLFCEPVYTGEGETAENGVVSWLVTRDGRLLRSGDVRPGRPDRIRRTYGMGVLLEGLSMSHQELCRAGLFVRDASVSDDGRVSSGRGSAAVRAAGASWREGPAGGRFDVPADHQLRQARADDAGEPLLFLRGRVVGTDGDAVYAELVGGIGVRIVPPEGAGPVALDNLRMLVRAPPHPLLLIGRALPGLVPTLRLLALAGDDGAALALPPAWEGKCNIAFDALQAGMLGIERAAVQTPPLDERVDDPLEPLRQRAQALVLSGRLGLPAAAVGTVGRERAGLDAVGLGAAAAALGGVLAARFVPGAPEPMRAALLRLLVVERACRLDLEASRWAAP